MRLLLLFVSLLTLSCRREQLPGPTPGISTPAGAPAAPATYLALGDSYTIGEGAANADRWPVQLAELTRPQAVGFMGPDLVARTGWTTAELADAITSAHLAKTYDVVSLLIGVNNQYRGQPVGRYRTELQPLLHTALGLAGGRGGRVFVLCDRSRLGVLLKTYPD